MHAATAFYRSLLVLALAAPCFAQSPQPPSPPPDAAQQPAGSVIFSRSTDEDGVTTSAGSAAPPPAGTNVSSPVATDAERLALVFTAFDIDAHLRLAEHQLAVRAAVTVRNAGSTPLAHIPLQISSTLNWERIRAAGHDVPFTVATLDSDVDHTGQLHEAAISPAAPLAPGATLQLDVTYSGTIALNAQRLLAIGTPGDVSLHSDWDAIDPDFTGVRGFGNVLWYPASSVPAILGDGARVFETIGLHKLRISGAQFRLHLAAEFARGQAPTIALINGQLAPLTVTDAPTEGSAVPGVATASIDRSTLGFEAPSFFLAIRSKSDAANTAFFSLPEHQSAIEDWSASVAAVTPFLEGWLGEHPRTPLTVLDLPDPADAPFETGSLLVTAIRPATSQQLDGVMIHVLTHAWIDSPRIWLSEGLARFMSTLWIEKSTPSGGRQKALESLDAVRPALALVEPTSPGASAGQPLGQAVSPVYYSTKAAYVFWMLRDLVGDPALSAALRSYDPGADLKRGFGPDAASGTFASLIEKSMQPASSSSAEPGSAKDLSWFFSDWLNADKGLPDLSIEGVFPSHTEGDNYLVSVNLANAGYAAAEVPVTVSNNGTSVTQRVLIPAHGKAVQRILIQGQPTQVQVNDGTVPETQATVHITTLTAADIPAPTAPLTPHKLPRSKSN